MSLANLLVPEAKDEGWAQLYANSLNCVDLTLQNIHIQGNAPLIVGDLTVTGDFNVLDGQAIIGPNNFQVSNGAGLAGQVLTTDGAGITSWSTNGVGDVMGLGLSIAGNLPEYVDGTGKIIQDSGVAVSSLVTNPLSGDLDCGGYVLDDSHSLVLLDQALISPPAIASSHRIWLSQADQKVHSLSDLGVDHALAEEYNDVIFQSIDGLQGYLGIDKAVGGDGNIIFYSAGAPQKYIYSVAGGGLQFKNSTFNDILELKESKEAAFSGDISCASGNVTISGNNFKVSNGLGSSGQLLSTDGAGVTTWSSQYNMYTLGFGGSVGAVAVRYFRSWNDPNGSTDLVETSQNRLVIPFSNTLTKITYSTQLGTATTQFSIYKNSVAQSTFLLSGASGVRTESINYVEGDTVSISYDGVGVNPMDCCIVLFFRSQ